MKKLTTLLFILIGFACYGQIPSSPKGSYGVLYKQRPAVNFNDIPCGTWVKLPQEVSEWQTVDTLGDKKHFDDSSHWVYDEERLASQSQWTNAIYSPCGFGDPDIYEQYRIGAGTGIRQVRKRIIRQKYIEPEKSEYEKVLDSLSGYKPYNANPLASLFGCDTILGLYSLQLGTQKAGDIRTGPGGWWRRNVGEFPLITQKGPEIVHIKDRKIFPKT